MDLEEFKIIVDNLIKEIPFEDKSEMNIEQAIDNLSRVKEAVTFADDTIKKFQDEVTQKNDLISQLKNSNFSLSRKLDIQNATIEKDEKEKESEDIIDSLVDEFFILIKEDKK